MNIKLEPCPFCGGEAIFRDVASYRYDIFENKLYEVGCTTTECHACIYDCTPVYESKEDAAFQWNKRWKS